MGPDKKETVLYDSETVGGEDAKKGEGLHQATDALEKYLYLDRLSKGDVASVHLTVSWTVRHRVMIIRIHWQASR